jgi:DNA-3-methyladenine glycosylase I
MEKGEVKPDKSYCEFASGLPLMNVDRIHHDNVHGFAVTDDNELFGRFILEINQAGLNWTLILKKEANFRQAYSGYDVSRIALYGEADRHRLLADGGIVRNRRKIDAIIYNAGVVLALQQEYGSFKAWLDQHHPKELTSWIRLFKETFRFTGPEIVNEWLMSTGYIEGAHQKDCPVYKQVVESRPMWLKH